RSGLVALPAGVVLDLDQLAAGAAPDIAAGEDEAAVAAVEGLYAAGVIAEVERDPALAALVPVRAVRGAVHEVLHLGLVHADLELREGAALHRGADHLPRERAVPGFDLANFLRSGGRCPGHAGGEGDGDCGPVHQCLPFWVVGRPPGRTRGHHTGRGRAPTAPVHVRSPPASWIQASISRSSRLSGTTPVSNTRLWNSRGSKRSPRASRALSRRRIISSWPTLYEVAWPGMTT